MKNIVYSLMLLFLIGCNNKNENRENNIIGKWVIQGTEVDNFSLPNGCKNLSKGDILIFDSNSNLVIERKNEKKCNYYNYKIENQEIKILTSDVAFTISIKQLNNKKLILSNKYLPERMMIEWKESYLKYKQEGFLIHLKRE